MNNIYQELNLVDKLILLALDDEKGTFVSNSMVFGYCVAGAALFELSLKKKLTIEENRVKLLSRRLLQDEVLDTCLDMISNSNKERSLKHWIEKIGWKESDLRKKVLSKLISLGILKEVEDKILWIFTHKKYPTTNNKPENLIRKRLKDIVAYAYKAETEELMLISLVDACSLNKEVYGKALAKTKAKEIKRLIKDFEFADSTGKMIKELHDTIMAVIVVMMAATVASTSS
jgi:hypothetical protein